MPLKKIILVGVGAESNRALASLFAPDRYVVVNAIAESEGVFTARFPKLCERHTDADIIVLNLTGYRDHSVLIRLLLSRKKPKPVLIAPMGFAPASATGKGLKQLGILEIFVHETERPQAIAESLSALLDGRALSNRSRRHGVPAPVLPQHETISEPLDDATDLDEVFDEAPVLRSPSRPVQARSNSYPPHGTEVDLFGTKVRLRPHTARIAAILIQAKSDFVGVGDIARKLETTTASIRGGLHDLERELRKLAHRPAEVRNSRGVGYALIRAARTR